MTTPLRVAAFLAALGVAFLAAFGVGRVVDPISTEPEAHDAGHESPEHGDEHLPGGLMVSQDGYTLRFLDPSVSPGRQVPVSFLIGTVDGILTGYDVEHEKQLHLIAVRRDFSGFQHVHPELEDGGIWRARLDLTPGEWRLFADFKPADGEALTLGADLAVTGRSEIADTPEEPQDERLAVVDGYAVRVKGDLVGGTESPLTLAIEKVNGESVDIEPYLGAAGHLVALREGDLAYLHVHPESMEELKFLAEVPSVGRYHLYLDFKVDGVVRTAAFTLWAGDSDDY